jgi:hypothetical protein
VYPGSCRGGRPLTGCTFEFNLPYLPDRKDVDRMGHCAARVMGDYYPVAAWCDK